MKFLLLAFLALSLTSCMTSLWHKNIGHIDLTPRVDIIRGNAPEVCRTGEKTKLTFFIHLLNMPPQDVFVIANDGPELNLFGKDLTVTVGAVCPENYACQHVLKIRVAGKIYEVTATVFDCGTLVKGN
jgi:hypothetical protein